MRGLLVTACMASALGFADTIHLSSGKVVQGVVVQETPGVLQVETAAGIMKFNRAEVALIDHDNTQVLASLQRLVQTGEGAEAVDRISRLDRSRFTEAEQASIDQLAAQVKLQSATVTAQAVNAHDQKVAAEAAALFEKLGWRESANYLEKACSEYQHPLPHSQFALIELYAAHSTYPEAIDFAPKADAMLASTNPQYKQTLAASRQKLDSRIAELTVEKQKRDEAFGSATGARARLEQAAYQRAQVAAIQGARIAAANPQKFRPKAPDASKIEAAKKSRAAMLTREAMDKAGVKMNCQGGVCPSR